MRVVVDLGCMERNGANSLKVLAEEYKPTLLFGFDPSPQLDESMRRVGDVPVIVRREAAWVHDGLKGFVENGSVSALGSGPPVMCFDFSEWLRAFKQEGDEVIVKMDIEGAEVPVLEKMVADGTDLLVDELLVEWHGQSVEGLRCPVREWWL